VRAAQPLSLKARAIALLAQREHSRSELRRKLLRIARDQRAAAARQSAAAKESLCGDPAWFEPLSPESPERLSAREQDEGGVREDPEEGGSEEPAAAIAAEVDALLLWLQERGYLNEERFVDARIHARARRFGSQRIQQELAQHGVQMSAEQRASLKDSELARAREVWQRKFAGRWPEDAAMRAKQTRFLISRGFGSEVVRRILRGPADEDES
jgi:regulatory protein